MLTVELHGLSYTLGADDIRSLRESLHEAAAGAVVGFRLGTDAKRLKPKRTAGFWFCTKRGTERVSNAEQEKLLRLCDEAEGGWEMIWPEDLVLKFEGVASE